MTNLRTTVIAKTDIVGFTPRLTGLSEAELDALLKQHKEFITGIVGQHQGTIIRREGDAFWIVFPSVTTAVLAAIDMHQRLRVLQAGRGDEHRLAIRVMIAVGDVLHSEQDIFGSTLSLIARMEDVTPPDEIYLSHAAWLTLNRAEVPTAFVNAFTFKGIAEVEAVYRVEQKHRTRVVTGQTIVFTDARGWPAFVEANTLSEVEAFALGYDDVIKEVCEAHGGIIRNFAGDTYLLTFAEVPRALAAIQRLCRQWKHLAARYGIGLLVGVHWGDIHILRSYVYGQSITISARLLGLGALVCPDMSQCSVVVSQSVRDTVEHTAWAEKLERVDLGQTSAVSTRELAAEPEAYRLVIEPEE
jgi:class 3 adenylate cyclase